jgi:hypothetical protein
VPTRQAPNAWARRVLRGKQQDARAAFAHPTSPRGERGIERHRGLAEDPFLVAIAGERKRLPRCAEDFRQGTRMRTGLRG